MKRNFLISRFGVIFAAAGLVIVAAMPSWGSSPEAQVAQGQMVEVDIEADEVTVNSLPDEIAEAVIEDVAERSGMSASTLKIIQVARQTWPNGCLGLGDDICTQAVVPGWQVIVAGEDKMWAYRTDISGSLVKYDEVLSQRMTSRVARFSERRELITTRRTQTTQVSAGASRTTQTRVSADEASRTNRVGASVSGQQAAASSAQMRRTVLARFSDVSTDYWAADFIAELTRQGIITGFPDGRFRPNEPVTRAQFAAMLRKAFEKSKVRSAIDFRDVSTSYWAYSAIRESFETGLLGVDTNNEFNPSQGLSRLQVLATLMQALNYSTTDSVDSILQFYSDAAVIPANARTLVAAATQRGIVVNYPNVKVFNPTRVATRAEVAAFIYQALVSTGDMVQVSSPYVVGIEAEAIPAVEENEVEVNQPRRQNCNQGIGNGAEGCDPGNSRPHGGSNDEGGRTPGNR
jgi:hypothetical protein